jgi:endothelin-converting enzyme/putative endopeptidase
MPNRNYYLDQGEQFDKYRTGYRAFVTTALRLAGFSEPEQRADRIIALERRIAEVHWTPEESRNVVKLINPMTPAKLAEYAPQFNWPLLLRTMKLDSLPTIIVANDTAIQKQSQLFAEVPIETWKEWTAFHLIRSYSNFLPKAFDQASFEFYGKTLSGQPQQRERWKRGLGVVNGALGEAVGQLYVHGTSAFEQGSDGGAGPQSARRIRRAAAAEQLDGRGYQEEALAKLEAFDPRVGYPISGSTTARSASIAGDLLGNMRARLISSTICSYPNCPRGRPLRMGDDAADHQRLLQPAQQPDHLPGSDPAAALLRSQCRCGGQLRRHRRGDRP